jgi:hypothetical protein
MKLEYNIEESKKLEEKFQEIYEFSDLKLAAEFYNSLDKLLTKEKEKQNPGLYKKYQHLKAKYGFTCLASLSEKEILELLENHFSVMLELADYNLWDNFKKYLVVFADYKERDRIKNDIKNILIKSQAVITETNIISDKKEIPGTLTNWLKDYRSEVGVEPADSLKFEQYFTNAINIRRLKSEEKNRVKSILKFYERLKLSSNSPKGFEEKVPMEFNGKLQIWSEGQLEDIDPEVIKVVEDLKARGFFKEKKEATTSLDELKKMVASYPIGSFERKAIEEEIKKFES